MYESTHPQEHNCWMWSSKFSTKGETHTHMQLGVILDIYWWVSTRSTVLEQIHMGSSKSYKIHHHDELSLARLALNANQLQVTV